MARIYSFRNSQDMQENSILAMFNQAVCMIFRPKMPHDPALIFCDLLVKTIITSKENPHFFLSVPKGNLQGRVEAG